MRKIGISIPTWCRYEQTIASFEKVLHDERVESVTIVDDASTDQSYGKLVHYFAKEPKVKLYRNLHNIDCYFNKKEAVWHSNQKWVALIDSDNVIDTSYLDALYAIPEWDSNTIYQPVRPFPHFDFTKWEGLTITRQNVADYVDTHLMTSLNACNHFVHRASYLNTWDGTVNPHTSDSLYFSYCWLHSGRSIYLTPNLSYYHHIADDNSGHYQQNYRKTVKFHAELMQKIREIK